MQTGDSRGQEQKSEYVIPLRASVKEREGEEEHRDQGDVW